MTEPNAAFFWQSGEATATEDEEEGGTPQATKGAIALAAELGIDLNTITGTGLHGRITKADVEAKAAEGD